MRKRAVETLMNTGSMMNRNKLMTLLALGVMLFITGCTTTRSKSAGTSSNTSDAARAGASAASNSPLVITNTSASNTATGKTASQASKDATAVGNNSRPANLPKPQIASGGNDFYLFTQTRAALASDAELKGANVIIDVKEGVLTLSGAAVSEAQKARAEQVARSVEGVKLVRNQIKVSAGG